MKRSWAASIKRKVAKQTELICICICMIYFKWETAINRPFFSNLRNLASCRVWGVFKAASAFQSLSQKQKWKEIKLIETISLVKEAGAGLNHKRQ